MSAARIERCIHLIRGQRIMLDADLAPLYGVSTRVLTQAVRRNRERFPGVGSGNSGSPFPEILVGAEDDASGSWVRSSFACRVR